MDKSNCNGVNLSALGLMPVKLAPIWPPVCVNSSSVSTSRFTTLCPVVGYSYVLLPTVLLTSSASAYITVASCMPQVWHESTHPAGRTRYYTASRTRNSLCSFFGNIHLIDHRQDMDSVCRKFCTDAIGKQHPVVWYGCL